ncbi:MAG: ThuA domain-containing protein, partial [Fibrobacteres bacterium]|nr:ThuA domain-containing protein [Fibrobacterota bacterium]
MIINETGSGGYAHTTQINYTSNYYTTYLAPKYGFTTVTPATQAAIDAEMTDANLKTYDVVIFNGGTRIGGAGAVGDTAAQHAFQRYLKAGGGCLAIHGLLDHNNTWPWLRDSVLNGSIFTQHSAWGQDPNAKVQWDTLKTSGELRSMKTEYDSIRACYPKTKFTYPDEWYSTSPNVRPIADVLMTIDENSYTVPSGSSMGLGHPVMWAYHLPADKDG